MSRNEKVIKLNLDSGGEYLRANIELNKEVYLLQMHPTLTRFALTFPDGSEISDQVSRLGSYEKLIRSRENDLYEVLEVTFRSHQLRIEMGQDKLSVKIPVEGHKYRLTFNIYSGELELYLPEYIMIADRDKLVDSFPELQRMEYGTIHAILTTQIIDADPVFISTTDQIPKSTLPVQIVKPNQYLIGKYYFRVQYLIERDVCFVEVPDRVMKTTLKKIRQDIPELEDLHGGKLLMFIEDELQRHGLSIGVSYPDVIL